MGSAYFCLTPLALWQYFAAAHQLNPECSGLLASRPEFYPPMLSLYLPLLAMAYLMKLPFFAWLLRYKQRFSWLMVLGIVFILNIVTHPSVSYFLPWIARQQHWSYAELMLASEVFTPMVEVIICWRLLHLPLLRVVVTVILASLLFRGISLAFFTLAS